MLEKIDLHKKLTKKEWKPIEEELTVRIGILQRQARELGIPVMVVFEGWSAAGKGTLINNLIHPLDPRGFQVFTTQKPSEDEKLHPFLWRFFNELPSKGRIHIFDRSWYQGLFFEEAEDFTLGNVLSFEEQMVQDGILLIKFFLHISQKEQAHRFQTLTDKKGTSWRVTKKDWEQNKHYERYLNVFDEVLLKTDTPEAPWTIVEACDHEYALGKILTTFANALQDAIHKKQTASLQVAPTGEEELPLPASEVTGRFKNGVLAGVDLSLTMDRDTYRKELKKYQTRISELHNEMYLRRIPVVLAFEGWDAGGKGGAIKRLTETMDPRGYEVVPVCAPNDIEKSHHYLWRFWQKFPKAGHMTIFDRTWYGRVMVERIEGFCSTNEWQRAYREINQMEENLVDAGAIVLKFWMHIDKDEQERRFTERQNIPEKQWKITDEDWRNRAKWDEYEKAVDEMILRTSTADAPWIIVEANSKYYARIKVLKTVVEALEKRMK